MATLMPAGSAVPLPAEAPPPGVPGLSVPDSGRLVGAESRTGVSDESLARRVADAHVRGLRARHRRDLTSQKYMLHADGEGGAQWADVFYGEKLVVPITLSSSQRPQDNLERPILANAVAYDTAQPFRFITESSGDPDSRARARMDQIFANQLSQRQYLNGIVAEAEFFALCHGFWPMHCFWREDVSADYWEPTFYAPPEGQPAPQGPRRGMIDLFAGDGLDFVLNYGAKRGSTHWASYGRTLPADIVRRITGRDDLHGSRRLASASQFQRTLRQWMHDTLLGVHGSAALGPVQDVEEADELIALVCREWAPGVDADYPDGRLIVVALNGQATTVRGVPQADAPGNAVLVHDGKLPGGCFSWELLYGDQRFDDPLGKPWAADIDALQMRLNEYHALYDEYLVRANSAALVRPTGMEADTDLWEPDAELEIGPTAGGSPMQPFFLGPYDRHLERLQWKIEDTRSEMFRIGGYQAASRGESHSGDPAALVVALQQADKTIHGPRNQSTQRTVCAFMQKAWRQMKAFGDVPWLIDMAGEDAADLAEPYLDKTKLSENPPNYKLVNSFGVTPEAASQELTGLVQMKGADGEAILSTRDYRARYPNQSIFAEVIDAKAVKERRANTINARLRQAVLRARQAYGLPPYKPGDPPGQEVQQLAQSLFQPFMAAYPQRRDDDLTLHVDALSQLTQNENEDPVVRLLAEWRQGLYYAWQAQMAAPVLVGGVPASQGDAALAPGDAAPGASAGVIPLNASNAAAIHGRVNDLTRQATHMGGAA